MQGRDWIFPCFVLSLVSLQRRIHAAGACSSVFSCLFTGGNSSWEKKERYWLPSFVAEKIPKPLVDKSRLEQVEQ